MVSLLDQLTVKVGAPLKSSSRAFLDTAGILYAGKCQSPYHRLYSSDLSCSARKDDQWPSRAALTHGSCSECPERRA